MDNNCLKCDYSLICFSFEVGYRGYEERTLVTQCDHCEDFAVLLHLVRRDTTPTIHQNAYLHTEICDIPRDAQCPCFVKDGDMYTGYDVVCARCEEKLRAAWDGKYGQ